MEIIESTKIPKAKLIDLNKVDLQELQEICWDLIELCEKENGIGISAVQAGIPMSLFLVKNILKKNYDVFINCNYFPVGDKEKLSSQESCLSLKKEGKLRVFNVLRFPKILVKGFSFDLEELKINPISKELVSLYSNVFQHEIDHCNDILISDIGEEINA